MIRGSMYRENCDKVIKTAEFDPNTFVSVTVFNKIVKGSIIFFYYRVFVLELDFGAIQGQKRAASKMVRNK